jgi:hypothetical protein
LENSTNRGQECLDVNFLRNLEIILFNV